MMGCPMDSDLYRRLSEAIRIRGERPAREQFQDMVDRGVIDVQGNVLVRGPREIWREQFEQPGDAPQRSHAIETCIEGILHAGPNRSGFALADVLTLDRTVCHIPPHLHPIARGAFGRRVSLEGTVTYGRNGVPVTIEVTALAVMPGMHELSQFGPGQKVDITDGVASEDYVRAMRDETDQP